MASSPTTSASSGVSGLGIVFQQQHSAPLSPTAPTFTPASPAKLTQQSLRPLPPQLQQQHRPLKHSASYDDGLYRRGTAQYAPHQQYDPQHPAPLDGRPRLHLAGVVSPELIAQQQHAAGKQLYGEYSLPANLVQAYGYLSPEALSDQTYSTASSPASGGEGYSPQTMPQPMSSLPSGNSHTGMAPAFHYAHQQGSQHSQPYMSYDERMHAPGMGALVSQPYPPSSAAPTAGHSPTSNSQTYDPASFSRGASRLPPFLRARQERALARPQSMLELNAVYTRQQGDVPGLLHARRTETPFAYSSCGEMSSSEGDRSRLNSLQPHSPPESIPSSAGGLQRQRYERQLADVRAEAAAATARAEHLAQQAARSQAMRHSRSHENLRSSASGSSQGSQQEQRRRRTRSRSMSAAGYPDADEDVVRSSPALGRARGHAHTKSDLAGGSRRPSKMHHLDAVQHALDMSRTPPAADDESDGEHERERVSALPPRAHSIISHASHIPSPSAASQSSHASNLSRHATLLTAGANPTRRRNELDRLLAPTSTKAAIAAAVHPAMLESPASASSASLAPSALTRRAVSRASSHPNLGGAGLVNTPVILEQAKSSSRARVELDLVLESGMVVEGGSLRGKIEVKVRRPKPSEGELWLGKPKVRVVGFEELASQEARHIFFHHASSIATLPSGAQLPMHSSLPDEESFARALEGAHAVPFAMRLPIGKGAKGSWKGKQGVVKYILIASIKLKSVEGTDRSIAHFYRTVDVYPYFPPALALAPAPKPLVAVESKGLFMGGNGKVTLTARIHRGTWVAGQQCYVDVGVENDTSKRVKSLSLALIRTTTVSRPPAAQRARQPSAESQLSAEDVGFTAQASRKKVAETVLEMGKKANGVTARGSWMGVDAGESANFSHALLIPSEALTVPKGKHLEVSYAVRVSVGGSLSSDVSADIPVRIINFVSLDPPPGHIVDEERTPQVKDKHGSKKLNKSWSVDQLRAGQPRAQQLQRDERKQLRPMPSVGELRLEDLNLGAGLDTGLSPPPPQPRLTKAASSDSLRVESYRSLRGAKPALSAVGEASPAAAGLGLGLGAGLRSPQESLVDPSEVHSQHRDSMSTATSFGCATIGRAHGRALTHQASLESISSAIASATARRNGSSPLERKRSMLSMATTTTPDGEDDDEDGDGERASESAMSHWDERERQDYEQLKLYRAQQEAGRRAFELAQHAQVEPLEREREAERRIELDDLEDDEQEDVDGEEEEAEREVDDALAYRSPAQLDYTDDSEEEIDAVMQGGINPEYEADELTDSLTDRPAFDNSLGPRRLTPSSSSVKCPASAHVPSSPAKLASRPASPVKQQRPASSSGAAEGKKSGNLAYYATPGSPIKAKVTTGASASAELSPAPSAASPTTRSPGRRVLSQADISPASTRRPLPTAPGSSSRPSSVAFVKVARPSSPVKAQAVTLKKQSSTASLRSEASPSLRKAASARSLGSLAMRPTSSAEGSEGLMSPPTSVSVNSSPEMEKNAVMTASTTAAVASGTSPAISVSSVLAYDAPSPRASPRGNAALLSPRPASSRSARGSPRTLHSSKSMSSLRSSSSPTSSPDLPQHQSQSQPTAHRLSARGPPPQPPPPRAGPVVLASVQSKIRQLESRQRTINAFAQPGGNNALAAGASGDTLQVAGPGLKRSDSVVSEAPSFRLADLERANSIQSFKAPMLKRRTLVEERGEPAGEQA